MSDAFRPAWWLPGPHSMTVWGRFLRERPSLPTTTETWDTPDGDQVDVVRLAAPATSPRLVLLHGLEGGIRSHYSAGLLSQAARLSWGADMLLFRTCNGRMNRQPRSYHSGETGDFDFVLRRIAAQFPAAPLGLVGVSLGGNVLLKWLGEQGAAVSGQVRAAAAVSVPFDLARSSRRIGVGASRLYERHFLRSLRRKALAKLERYPSIASRQAVEAATSLWTFDDAYTAIVHGFRDAADYYSQSSSIRFLQSIRVRTLLLSAYDDPFHPPEVLDEVAHLARENPHLELEFHARGGHVGFIEGPTPWHASFYAERRIMHYLDERLRTNA